MKINSKLLCVLLLWGALAVTGGCDWEDRECEDACQKMKKCEALHIPVEECRINCENQTLDCSEQIRCIQRSKCDAVNGCIKSYPCQMHSWDDDDEW